MNTLATLSLEQLDQVYDWLLEMPVHKVREKLAQPAPYGYGVETYITTLQRFKQRRYAELAADQLEAAKSIAASAQSNNPASGNTSSATSTTMPATASGRGALRSRCGSRIANRRPSKVERCAMGSATDGVRTPPMVRISSSR